MNPADKPASESVDAPQPAPAGRTNPLLTANLRADYDAVRNDLEQAQQLAADFQRQAADKSNEAAHIRRLLEKTKADLNQLEGHVDELRRERHRLANDLMIAAATELELRKVKKERDQLRSELESLEAATKSRIDDLQAQVAQQRNEIDEMAGKATTGGRTPGGVNDAAMQKINDLTATVTRLTSLVEGRSRRDYAAEIDRSTSASGGEEDDFINLSFER